MIMLFFEYTTNGVLFQPLNLTNLILQNSYVVVMALGMLLIIVAGHIDLSIGSHGRVRRGARGGPDGPVPRRVPHRDAALPHRRRPRRRQPRATGSLISSIPSFIVTLAGMLVFRGLTLAVLQGASVGPFPDIFQLLSKGFIYELRRRLHLPAHRGW